MSTIDVQGRERVKPRDPGRGSKTKLFDEDHYAYDYIQKLEKREAKAKTTALQEVERVAERKDLVELRDQALSVYEALSMELDIETEPKYNAPITWSFFSVKELTRGDGIMIDGTVYLYLEKLAWWRSKTANILIGQHDNPDRQKRIGELDFVYAFKGYVLAKQMAKIGVTF